MEQANRKMPDAHSSELRVPIGKRHNIMPCVAARTAGVPVKSLLIPLSKRQVSE